MEEFKLGSRSGRKEKYPFSQLELGESFPIPSGMTAQAMRCLAYQRGETMGRKFKVSKVSGTVERIK